MSKDLVFIASGGRTGTQFFGHMMGRIIADCWSEHEPDMVAGLSPLTLARIRRFGLWHMVPGRLLGRTGVRVLGRRLLDGSLSETECLERLWRTRRRYHAGIDETLVVESYYAWWAFAGLTDKIWPGSKMIGVIRDPRTWIESWRKHSPARRNGAWSEAGPFGGLTPADVGDAAWAARWHEIGQIGRLAWEWRMIYGRLAAAEDASPLVRVYRFEDVFGPSDAALESLVHFAAEHGPRRHAVGRLDGLRDSVLNASGRRGDGWRDWSSSNARIVDALCGPLMAHHGYGGEAAWRALVDGDRPAAVSPARAAGDR